MSNKSNSKSNNNSKTNTNSNSNSNTNSNSKTNTNSNSKTNTNSNSNSNTNSNSNSNNNSNSNSNTNNSKSNTNNSKSNTNNSKSNNNNSKSNTNNSKSNIESFYKKHKIIIISCIILLILIIVSVILYYYYKNVYNVHLYIEEQDSNKPFKISDEDIKSPKDGYNYSMMFFIYLDDYTENFKYWKHVMHKGNELRDLDLLKYNEWNDLTTDIYEQSPGLWINPTNTNLRISFNTEIYKDFCHLHNTSSGCNNNTYCKWTGYKCINNDEHATNMEYSQSLKDKHTNRIEYLDIEIPYKKMTHIGFVLENKVLNVYLNGKLRKIHKFMGEPIYNDNMMFFNYPTSYNGSLFNYYYIPYQINSEEVLKYSNDIPNNKLIPKSKRFNNFISRFKIIDAIQSFFI